MRAYLWQERVEPQDELPVTFKQFLDPYNHARRVNPVGDTTITYPKVRMPTR